MGKGIGIDMGMLHYLPPHPVPPSLEERGVGSREVISKVWKFGSLEIEVWNLFKESLIFGSLEIRNCGSLDFPNFGSLELQSLEDWTPGGVVTNGSGTGAKSCN